MPLYGKLKWDPETDAESNERSENLVKFLAAKDNGQDKEWIRNFFGEQYAESYPSKITVADAVEDIYSGAAKERGREVLRCVECERIYIQKERFENEWICYEKRNEI